MSLDGVTMRVHLGGEDQEPDPFIAAKMGAANTPAYRGTAYVVFEELPLERFGNRLPQLSFEVFRPILDGESAESLVRAVTLIPASGEFAYATEVVRREVGETTAPENVNAEAACRRHRGRARPAAGLRAEGRVGLARRRLVRRRPARRALPHPPGRRGQREVDDAGELVGERRRPRRRRISSAATTEDRPAYGGTPSDSAVVQAIQELKARGYRVTFYPFILMDVPADNDLPDPYSDNAAATGQPAYPWRGRITCSPAAGLRRQRRQERRRGHAGRGLLRRCRSRPTSTSTTSSVEWDGDPDDWGLRRMILHYAHLCAAAGGVDAFLIGSELRGITQVRSGASSYPAVAELVDLAADVRSILGSGTKLSYAADWSEYFGHHPQDGSGDVFFHLDPLWADDDDRLRRHRQLHAARRLARRARPSRRRRAPTRSPTSTTCAATSRAARASTGSTPAPPTARRRSARRSPTAPPGSPWVFRYKDIRALVVEPAPQPPGRRRERRDDGVGAGEQADPLHRDRLPGGRPRPEPAERLLRPEVGRELPAVLLPRLARRRRAAALPRGGARLLGRAGEQPDVGRLLRPDDHHRRDRGLDLGRAAVSGVPGAQRRLDRRRQLAARALAERPARLGLARQPGARALPPRRAARRARSTPRRSPTSCTAI